MFRRHAVSTSFVSSANSIVTRTQLRASRTAYLASTVAVGTVVVDQNTAPQVGPDTLAQSPSLEANTTIEPGPPKTVFLDLPEKVSHPFFSNSFAYAKVEDAHEFFSDSFRYTQVLPRRSFCSTRLHRSNSGSDRSDGKCVGTTRMRARRCTV